MLFEMYESYAEKAAPDIYNGLPITDRDDLINAVRDAAGYELAALVVKYLDKVEEQASAAVEDEATQAQDMEYDLANKEDGLQELDNSLRHLRDEIEWIIDGKDEGEEITYDDVHGIYEKVVDLIRF